MLKPPTSHRARAPSWLQRKWWPLCAGEPNDRPGFTGNSDEFGAFAADFAMLSHGVSPRIGWSTCQCDMAKVGWWLWNFDRDQKDEKDRNSSGSDLWNFQTYPNILEGVSAQISNSTISDAKMTMTRLP